MMKRVLCSALGLLFVCLDWCMAQEAIYVYKNDGTINQFVIAEITAMDCSMYDEDGVLQDVFCTQQFHLGDSIVTIPLELIDSISFLPPRPEESISPAYVPIDWAETRLVSADTTAYRFTFELSEGYDPAIYPGSVVIVQTEAMQHIVLVTQVEQKGQQLTIGGDKGSMAHIFFDTEFALIGSPEDSAPMRSAYRYNALDEESAARRMTAEGGDGTEMTQMTMTYQKSFPGRIDYLDGLLIHNWDYIRAQAYCDYNTTLSLNVCCKLRFGDPVEDKHDIINFIKARNFDIAFDVTGTQKFEADITADFEGKGDIVLKDKDSKDDYHRVESIRVPSVRKWFPIGNVPVELTIGGAFFQQVELTVHKAKFNFTMGFDAEATMHIGAKYDGITHQGFSHRFDASFTKTPHNPMISGMVDMEGKFYFFPRIHVWLYDQWGLGFDIKPYLHTHIKGGFDKDLVESRQEDYLGWSLTNTAGVDWVLSLSANSGYYGDEGWNFPILKGTFTPDEWLLYRSPDRIGFVSAVPNKIEANLPTKVTFEVFDKSFLGSLATPLAQVVKFQSNKNGIIEADLNSDFAIAKKGQVSATWIPTSSDEVLTARIYDYDGSILAEAKYGLDPVVRIDTVFDILGTSAKVRCTFLHMPLDATGVLDYRLSGMYENIEINKLELTNISGDSVSYVFELTGLRPNAEYRCCASAKWVDKYFNSGFYYFTTDFFCCPDENHPHAVDLGLPSGTKWACCNLEAASPTHDGGYFAWGETKSRDYFNWMDYEFCNSKTWDLRSIGSNIAGTGFDAVHVQLGNHWQMPSEEHLKELQENTTAKVLYFSNGSPILQVTGPSGEYILMPYAGLTWEDVVNDKSTLGYYWLSNIYEKDGNQAKNLYFLDPKLRLGKDFRGTGLPIRGIYKDNNN